MIVIAIYALVIAHPGPVFPKNVNLRSEGLAMGSVPEEPKGMMHEEVV